MFSSSFASDAAISNTCVLGPSEVLKWVSRNTLPFGVWYTVARPEVLCARPWNVPVATTFPSWATRGLIPTVANRTRPVITFFNIMNSPQPHMKEAHLTVGCAVFATDDFRETPQRSGRSHNSSLT